MHIIRFIMSYGRLFVINVMENAMRLICISNKNANIEVLMNLSL